MSTILGRQSARFTAALLAAGTLATGAAGAAAHAADDPPVSPQVIGGNPPTQAYPAGAFVSLKYDAPDYDRTNWHTCGGSLIFHNMVATAAHCVTDPPAGLSTEQIDRLARAYHLDPQSLRIPTAAKSFWVRVGSTNKENGGVIANARVKAVHPKWSWATQPGSVADIAVLELDQYIDMYTLPLAPRAARPGEEVFHLGWGVSLPNGSGPLPSDIQELRSVVTNSVNCGPGQPFGFSDGDVCVDNPNGTDGACYGDSGGPLPIKIRGVWYNAGITSRGLSERCGVTDEIYTSAPDYRSWIYDTAYGTAAPIGKFSDAREMSLPYEKPGVLSTSETCRC